MPLFVAQIDLHSEGNTLLDCSLQGAAREADEVALIVHVIQNVVHTVMAHDLLGWESRKLLGFLIPKADLAVLVYDIHALSQVGEELVQSHLGELEFWCHGSSLRCRVCCVSFPMPSFFGYFC